jgi:hypothetical protein
MVIPLVRAGRKLSTFLSSPYTARTGNSFFRRKEKVVSTKEERRIAAGINWAKMTMIPKVTKNKTPKSPIPFTPPTQAIPIETRAIAVTKTRLRMIKILFVSIALPLLLL